MVKDANTNPPIEKEKTADALNNYFINIGENLAQLIETPTEHGAQGLCLHRVYVSLF